MYHTGWISVYDNVGIVGMAAFIALQLAVILATARFVFGPKANRRSSLFPLYVWIQMNVTTAVVSYFTVFGSFNQAFTDLLAYAVVLSHLEDLEKSSEPALIPGERKKQVEFSGLSGANYGSRYGKY
jgi:hypothetical protein